MGLMIGGGACLLGQKFEIYCSFESVDVRSRIQMYQILGSNCAQHEKFHRGLIQLSGPACHTGPSSNKKNQVAMGPIKFYSILDGSRHHRDLTKFEIENNMGSPCDAMRRHQSRDKPFALFEHRYPYRIFLEKHRIFLQTLNPNKKTQNPKPKTQNPKPKTQNFKPKKN